MKAEQRGRNALKVASCLDCEVGEPHVCPRGFRLYQLRQRVGYEFWKPRPMLIRILGWSLWVLVWLQGFATAMALVQHGVLHPR